MSTPFDNTGINSSSPFDNNGPSSANSGALDTSMNDSLELALTNNLARSGKRNSKMAGLVGASGNFGSGAGNTIVTQGIGMGRDVGSEYEMTYRSSLDVNMQMTDEVRGTSAASHESAFDNLGGSSMSPHGNDFESTYGQEDYYSDGGYSYESESGSPGGVSHLESSSQGGGGVHRTGTTHRGGGGVHGSGDVHSGGGGVHDAGDPHSSGNIHGGPGGQPDDIQARLMAAKALKDATDKANKPSIFAPKEGGRRRKPIFQPKVVAGSHGTSEEALPGQNVGSAEQKAVNTSKKIGDDEDDEEEEDQYAYDPGVVPMGQEQRAEPIFIRPTIVPDNAETERAEDLDSHNSERVLANQLRKLSDDELGSVLQHCQTMSDKATSTEQYLLAGAKIKLVEKELLSRKDEE